MKNPPLFFFLIVFLWTANLFAQAKPDMKILSTTQYQYLKSLSNPEANQFRWRDPTYTGFYAIFEEPETLQGTNVPLEQNLMSMRYALNGVDSSFAVFFNSMRPYRLLMVRNKEYFDNFYLPLLDVRFDPNKGDIIEINHIPTTHLSFEHKPLEQTFAVKYGDKEMNLNYGDNCVFEELTFDTENAKTCITIDSVKGEITAYKHISSDGSEINFNNKEISKILAEPDLDHVEVIKVINALLVDL